MDKTKWDILRGVFPKEAYSEDNSRGFKLTTINAYYIIERLNEALGICGTGWRFEVKEWIKNEKEVICIGDLHYFDGKDWGIVHDVVGSHKAVHGNWGDCYKSARTNAISKGASELEVGLNVYKGEFKAVAGQKPSPSTPKPVPSTKPNATQGPDGKDGKLIALGNTMLEQMSQGDPNAIKALVNKHSGFDGDKGRVERDSLEQLKDKWLFKTFKNIEGEYDLWKDTQDNLGDNDMSITDDIPLPTED